MVVICETPVPAPLQAYAHSPPTASPVLVFVPPRIRARQSAISAIEVHLRPIVKPHRTAAALADRPIGQAPIREADPSLREAWQPIDGVVVIPLGDAQRRLQVPCRGPLGHHELRAIDARWCGHRLLSIALHHDPANWRQVVGLGLRLGAICRGRTRPGSDHGRAQRSDGERGLGEPGT